MVIYIDMDGVLCDYEGSKADYRKKHPEIKHAQYEEGFFSELNPIKDAVGAFWTLTAIKNFEVYILTSPAEKSPKCYSEKREWVEKYIGPEAVNRLIISPHKHLLKGDYLIDDHTEGKGQDKFEGKFLHFGSADFPDWNTILKYFDKLEA